MQTTLTCPDADASVKVQVEMDGHGIDEKELDLTAGRQRNLSLTFGMSREGTVHGKVTIDHTDPLESEVVASQRRSLVARNEAGGTQTAAPVAPHLV